MLEFTLTIYIFQMLMITSLNINGLRSELKINAVLGSCKAEIFCLQETWWDERLSKRASEIWRGMCVSNEGTSKSSGVAILCKGDLADSLELIHQDKEGRVLVVDITLKSNNKKYRIMNVYAPNNENLRCKLFTSLEKWFCNDIIIVGDFNVVFSKNDVSRNNTYKNDYSRTKLMDTV